MSLKPVIYRLGFDTRFHDNPALTAASETKRPIIFVYIHDDTNQSEKFYGDLQKLRIRESLKWFAEELKKRGSQLILRKGAMHQEIVSLVKEVDADTVLWNRRYIPHHVAIDNEMSNNLTKNNIITESFKANLLFEPNEIKNKSNEFYKVYTPFKNACLAFGLDANPLRAVTEFLPYQQTIKSVALDDLYPLPTKPDWANPILAQWIFSEDAALKRMIDFFDNGLNNYKEGRNYPALPHVSKLSPYLAQGLISPRTIISSLSFYPDSKDKDHFISEILWREFSYYLMSHAPYIENANFKSEWDNFPWKNLDDAQTQEEFHRWTKGKTTIPLIDAAMQELWQTGYMHNRTRMVVASYLVKHMMIHWQHGEEWFKNTLIDYDTANNIAGWQWVAGCGADAAPYFRVFNPITQGEKFDPDCMYIKHYVPELKSFSSQYIHNCHIDRTPNLFTNDNTLKPIIDINKGRDRALEAYQTYISKASQ